MDTNDQIRSVLIKNLLSPWVWLAFCVGFGLGWTGKSICG